MPWYHLCWQQVCCFGVPADWRAEGWLAGWRAGQVDRLEGWRAGWPIHMNAAPLASSRRQSSVHSPAPARCCALADLPGGTAVAAIRCTAGTTSGGWTPAPTSSSSCSSTRCSLGSVLALEALCCVLMVALAWTQRWAGRAAPLQPGGRAAGSTCMQCSRRCLGRTCQGWTRLCWTRQVPASLTLGYRGAVGVVWAGGEAGRMGCWSACICLC